MKKKLVASGIFLVAVGSGFAANNIMINKASQEVPQQILRALQKLDSNAIQVQRLTSNVNGSKIDEQYVIYPVFNGKRVDKAPIFINHTANIGLFASSVSGHVTIVKDKGLAKTFIENVATINDNIHYSFSTANEKLDLNGEIQIGKIQDGLSSLELGKLTFSTIGSSNQITSTMHLPSFVYNKRNEQFSLTDITMKSVGGDNLPKNTFDITTGKINILEKRFNQSIQVAGLKWNTALTNEPSATLTTDIEVNKLNFNLDNAPKDNFDITLNINVPGIPASRLQEAADSIDHGNIAQERVKKILNELLNNGINGNSITLRINNSSAKGFIALAPANYSEMQPYQKRTQLISNLSAQVDFDLEKSLVESMPKISPVVERYFDLSPKDKYTGTFKLTEGQATLNGKPLQ